MCGVLKSLVQNYFPLSPWFFIKFSLILSPQILKNIPHRVVLTDSGHQELQQDRQTQAHMHTEMYTETMMACVTCFDSRTTAEIASIKK
jgi:hypothetical protein